MDFKFPAIFAIIIFVLIFFINLIVGNSFLVILLRSLLTGSLVFLIVFGTIYFFKNVLKIDFSSETLGEIKDFGKEKKREDEGVDVVIDDNIDTTNYNEESNGLEQDKLGEDKLENIKVLGDSENIEVNNELGNELDNKEELSTEKNKNFIDSKIEDLDSLTSSTLLDVESDETEMTTSNSDFNSSYMDDKDSNLSTSEIIKKKLGYEASNEEIAKAIKTVLKRDR